ncbi:MAG: HDOD domain-containing protein [Myxococcales bacterium]|nr:HDOD domain-containing protein [Myxococcales bacterium]
MGWVATLLDRVGWRPRSVDRAVMHRPALRVPIVEPVVAPADAGADAAKRQQERERADLEKSFRAAVVDRMFQRDDLDLRFVEELGSYLGKSQNEFALPPAAAFDVVRMIGDSGYLVRKVAAAISCDPTLAGAVLSLANSPLHKGEIGVDSVNGAVVRLGQRHLRMLLLDIALHSAKVRGRPFEAFSAALWKHSLLTANLSHQVAQLARMDPDQAYMAGLFHDIGSFAVIAAARRLAQRQERKLSPQTLLQCVRSFGYEKNGAIVARWRLPDAVTRAVTHRRDRAGAGTAAGLAAVIQLANDLSRPLGAWVEPRAVDLTRHPAVELLRIDVARLPDTKTMLDLAQKVERVGQLV